MNIGIAPLGTLGYGVTQDAGLDSGDVLFFDG